jgi:hypothetical protein
MKAIVQDAYGPPDLLELEEIDAPTARDHEVVVRVRASSLHQDVWHMVRGVPRVLRIMGVGLLRPRGRVPGPIWPGWSKPLARTSCGFGRAMRCSARRSVRTPGGTAARTRSSPPSVRIGSSRSRPTLRSSKRRRPRLRHDRDPGLRDEGRIQAGQRVQINGAGGGWGWAPSPCRSRGRSERRRSPPWMSPQAQHASIDRRRPRDRSNPRGLQPDWRALRPDPRHPGEPAGGAGTFRRRRRSSAGPRGRRRPARPTSAARAAPGRSTPARPSTATPDPARLPPAPLSRHADLSGGLDRVHAAVSQRAWPRPRVARARIGREEWPASAIACPGPTARKGSTFTTGRGR